MSDDLAVPLDVLRTKVLGLDVSGAEHAARELLEAGADPHQVIQDVVKPTADEIGRKFESEEYFLPQLMLAGNALEAAMNVLLEALPPQERRGKRSVLIGTVRGDVHTIGKNIVAMMLRSGGFEVHDLGVDVEAKKFVAEAQERRTDIIALSSLLTTTLPYQREVIKELNAQGIREQFKVLVGGGPATPAWAEEIGADGYGKDAAEALALARRVLGPETNRGSRLRLGDGPEEG